MDVECVLNLKEALFLGKCRIYFEMTINDKQGILLHAHAGLDRKLSHSLRGERDIYVIKLLHMEYMIKEGK